MINAELGEPKLSGDVLDTVFEMWWPKLEEKVAGAMAGSDAPSGNTVRSQRELLEEILLLTRGQARRTAASGVNPAAMADLVEAYTQLVRDACSLGMAKSLGNNLNMLLPPVHHFAVRAPACRGAERRRLDDRVRTSTRAACNGAGRRGRRAGGR